MQLLRTQLSPRVLLSFLAASGLLGSSAADAASYPATVLADNPVAYYRFEDPIGSVALLDSSSSGAYPGLINFDGTLEWPKLQQPGVGSNSIAFHVYTDGGGNPQRSYANVPYTEDLNKAGPFTVEAWVRPTSVGTGEDWRSPVGNFAGWGMADYPGWFFYQSPAGADVSRWIWVQKGGGIWVGGVPVRKYQWDHLAASFDGTTVTFYVNGVNSGSANASSALPNPINPLCIGQRADGNCFFDGNVDDVAVYTNALTAAQIQLHYAVGLTNFYNGPIGAYVTQDPAPVTNYAGHVVTFEVGADGTSPLSYQWYKGNTAIPGATTDTLTFTCAFADNNTQYKVVVTNLYGSVTSASATLSVSTDLILVSSPATIARTVGSMAAFRVQADGALPRTYKWYKGAALIPGATGETLWLNNVQSGDDGTMYYAEVSTTWGTTNSEMAMLSVLPRTTVVPITGYAKVVAADGPVALWRLDETDGSTVAVDAIGSFDGEYDALGAGAFTPGVFTYGAATGIPYETNKAVVVTNGARIRVPYALELNPYGPFAAEAWIKPTSLSADGSDYRTIFSSEGSGVGGPIGWLLYQQPNHTFAWVVFADNWVSTFIGAGGVQIAANTWYHIVLQYDGSLFYVYVNGRLAGSAAFPAFVPNRNGAANFGWRSDNDWKPFAGTIDDVAFYNKALTAQQIQAHYLATIRLDYKKVGTNLELTWPFGTLQQSDQPGTGFTDLQSATSPYSVPTTGAPKYYRVKVQ